VSFDVGATATAASTALVAVLTWSQARRADRRADAKEERRQYRALLAAYLEQRRWIARAGPGTAAGLPPSVPEELDLPPWD
jgi:hypothetical protein